jgi:hypothetical protein
MRYASNAQGSPGPLKKPLHISELFTKYSCVPSLQHKIRDGRFPCKVNPIRTRDLTGKYSMSTLLRRARIETTSLNSETLLAQQRKHVQVNGWRNRYITSKEKMRTSQKMMQGYMAGLCILHSNVSYRLKNSKFQGIIYRCVNKMREYMQSIT